MRVAGVTRARIASTSAVRSFSGATTGVRAPRQNDDAVHEKAVARVDRLVAGAEVGRARAG